MAAIGSYSSYLGDKTKCLLYLENFMLLVLCSIFSMIGGFMICATGFKFVHSYCYVQFIIVEMQCRVQNKFTHGDK